MGGSAKRVTAEVMSRLIISYLLIPRGANCCFIAVSGRVD